MKYLVQNSGFVQSSNFQRFSRPKKRREKCMEIKFRKIVKNLDFFFQRATTNSANFFSFWSNLIQFLQHVCNISWIKALFLRLLRSLLITGLFDNLESGKEIIVRKKVLVYVHSLSWYMCTPYNDLNGVVPTESGTFFMSQVDERVGLLLVLCLAEWFFSRYSGFPLSPKTNLSDSNSIRNARTQV